MYDNYEKDEKWCSELLPKQPDHFILQYIFRNGKKIQEADRLL